MERLSPSPGRLARSAEWLRRWRCRAVRGSPASTMRRRRFHQPLTGSIEAAAAQFGRLDALINIAGGFAFETIADGDARAWERMYALNVMTALNASRAA